MGTMLDAPFSVLESAWADQTGCFSPKKRNVVEFSNLFALLGFGFKEMCWKIPS
jgi:hypothetical protein